MPQYLTEVVGQLKESSLASFSDLIRGFSYLFLSVASAVFILFMAFTSFSC